MAKFIEEFLTAIKSHFDDNTEGATLYTVQAPLSAVMPYVVLTILPAKPEDTLTESIEAGIIQFSIYSSSATAEEALDLQSDLQDAFDYSEDNVFDTTNYLLVSMERENGNLTMEEDEGKRVWSVMTQYFYRM